MYIISNLNKKHNALKAVPKLFVWRLYELLVDSSIVIIYICTTKSITNMASTVLQIRIDDSLKKDTAELYESYNSKKKIRR